MYILNIVKNKRLYQNSFHLLIILLLVFLFAILSKKAICQTDFRPGYYITWKNDTVYGLIDYRGEIRNSAFCSFKSNDDSESIRFEPADIQAYRFLGSKYYISRKIQIRDEEEQVFLEFLVNGITNLYYYGNFNNPCYFIEDDSGNLFKLDEEKKIDYIEGKGYVMRQDFRYIGLLKTTMADCMEIQKDIENVKLDHKSLINITKEYHEYVCEEEQCIIYEKRVPKVQLRIAPVLGLVISKLDFSENQFSNFDFHQTTTPQLGLLINMSLPRTNEKLSLELESSIFRPKYYGNYVGMTYNTTNYYEAYIKLLLLESSASIKYTFPRGNFRPTLALGFASDFVMNKDEKVIQESKLSSTVLTYETYTSPIASELYGACIKLGCNYLLPRNHSIFAAMAFKYLTKNENETQTIIQSISLNFGLYF